MKTKKQTTILIKQIIDKSGLKISKIAEILGIRPDSLSKTINKGDFSLKWINKVADICGVEVTFKQKENK